MLLTHTPICSVQLANAFNIVAIFYPFSQFCEIDSSLLSLQKQPNTAPNIFQTGVEYGKKVQMLSNSGAGGLVTIPLTRRAAYHIYIYIYIHTYLCMYIYIYALNTNNHIYISISLSLYIYIYIYIYTHIHI